MAHANTGAGAKSGPIIEDSAKVEDGVISETKVIVKNSVTVGTGTDAEPQAVIETGAITETEATASLNQLLSALRHLDLTEFLPINLKFKTYGGCADIWFGQMVNGMQVAVKRARVSGNKDDQERFTRVRNCVYHCQIMEY